MKAIGYRSAGPSSVLEDMEIPRPAPQARDLLVSVRAVSVNPVDTTLRAKARPTGDGPRILGFDAAGVVEAVGSDASLFSAGDEVFYAGSITRQGTNAQYHVVDERIVGRKPRSLSFAAAAALPLTTITAWELLFDRMRIPYGVKSEGGNLLVINGAGGVGSILIQLASRLTGLNVIATASRPESADWVRTMGAHQVVNHDHPLDEGIEALGVGLVDYVASLTATGLHLPAVAKIIAPQGHIGVIDNPAALDIVSLRAKSVTVSWEGMFTRSTYQTADMIAQHRLLNETAALVDSGVLRTTMRRELGVMSAASLARAHEQIETGKSIGKTVLAGIDVDVDR